MRKAMLTATILAAGTFSVPAAYAIDVTVGGDAGVDVTVGGGATVSVDVDAGAAAGAGGAAGSAMAAGGAMEAGEAPTTVTLRTTGDANAGSCRRRAGRARRPDQ